MTNNLKSKLKLRFTRMYGSVTAFILYLGKTRAVLLLTLALLVVGALSYVAYTLHSFTDVMVVGGLLTFQIVAAVVLSLSIAEQKPDINMVEIEEERATKAKEEKERMIKIYEYYIKEPSEIYNVYGIPS